MSTDITTFVFPESNQTIRTLITDNDETVFAAADVCMVLDIANVGNAVSRLSADDIHSMDVIDSIGRHTTIKAVNESGLYDLILDSRKPQARAFRRWVTGEVLPSIRKTGSYALVQRKDSELAEIRGDMRELKGMMMQLIGIAERNEHKIATHDLLVSSELNFTMREMGHILGFRDVRKFTATLRNTGVLIKHRYPVTYGGELKSRYRNTPRAQWHRWIEVKTQFSGANLVTVPYVKPSGVERLHAHLQSRNIDVLPLPSVDEQRAIVAELRRRTALEPQDDDYAIS